MYESGIDLSKPSRATNYAWVTRYTFWQRLCKCISGVVYDFCGLDIWGMYQGWRGERLLRRLIELSGGTMTMLSTPMVKGDFWDNAESEV